MLLHNKSRELTLAQGVSFASHGGEWTEPEKIEIFNHTAKVRGHRLARYSIYYEDYLLWLSSLTSQERSYIQRKAELQQTYREFEQPVKDLRRNIPHDLTGWDDYETHPAFISDDCMSVGMRLVHNGTAHSVRFMRMYDLSYREAQVDTEYYVDALVRCIGEPGTEQMIACSYEYCNTVCHELTGVDCRQLVLEQPIPPRHLYNVVCTQERLHELEVNTGAIMLYDPQDGFNFMGMFTSLPDARPLDTMERRIKRLIYTVGGAQRYQNAPPLDYDAPQRLRSLDDLELVVTQTQPAKTVSACALTFKTARQTLLPYARSMV